MMWKSQAIMPTHVERKAGETMMDFEATWRCWARESVMRWSASLMSSSVERGLVVRGGRSFRRSALRGFCSGEDIVMLVL